MEGRPGKSLVGVLEWRLKHGELDDSKKAQIERCVEEGKVPPILGEYPDLPDAAEPIVDAYLCLSRATPADRPISIESMQAYVSLFGEAGGIGFLRSTKDFLDLMQQMDVVRLEHYSEQMERATKGKGKGRTHKRAKKRIGDEGVKEE